MKWSCSWRWSHWLIHPIITQWVFKSIEKLFKKITTPKRRKKRSFKKRFGLIGCLNFAVETEVPLRWNVSQQTKIVKYSTVIVFFYVWKWSYDLVHDEFFNRNPFFIEEVLHLYWIISTSHLKEQFCGPTLSLLQSNLNILSFHLSNS